jgi:hypothetical protein
MDLRTNSDYFPMQYKLIGFITEAECLLRGTKYDSGQSQPLKRVCEVPKNPLDAR